MTERAPSITTQIAPPAQAGYNAATPISTNHALPVNESIEEEPYTIKCICDYLDDDGNTIFCEQCDTWQHIECYYPGRVADASKEEFDHSCADCKPRTLDSRNATERQRQQRHNKAANDTGDKKSKRPPSSKSHKKKVKPAEVQVNGYHEHDSHKNGSPQEHQPHTKKTKGHRSNQSVSSQHMKRSPPLNSRTSNHGHPPSPAQTLPDLPNDVQVHSYSADFLSLYDTDESKHSATSNRFANLQVTNKMALWVQDSEKLEEDTNIRDPNDVFSYLTVAIESLKWPEFRIETKEKKVDDNHLQWRYLTTPTSLETNVRTVELNGLVGFQANYCGDAANRWQETAHPRPFVFFHPRLPLVVDTRLEGSKGRYVRRSCRPNTTLETCIANSSEYHFWFITERPTPAREPLTIPWDFRFPPNSSSRMLQLLNLREDDGLQFDSSDITEEEYESLSSTIHSVLSDHGGCACELGNDCAFARFHRSYHGRLQNQLNGLKPKKSRKPKQNHMSPTSTGHATNSRAASEGQDQHDEDDSHSQSGSVRSKPRSRDLTPMHGVGDTNGILTEISDREKRKLAMLEDSFRKMESQPRKKKRVSDGSSHALPSNGQSAPKQRQRSTAPRASISQSTPITNGPRSRQYVDASTSRRQSGSPFSAISPTGGIQASTHGTGGNSIPSRSRPASAAPRGTYADSSTQTDPVKDAWWEAKPKPKRAIVPLAKRLLKNRQKIQAQQEAQAELLKQEAKRHSIASSPEPMDLDTTNTEHSLASPTDIKARQASLSSSISANAPHDVVMTDASLPNLANTIKPPPPPWPSNSTGPLSPRVQKSELRVQLPSAPIFSTPNMSGNPSAPSTPSLVTSATAQSPFGSIHPNALPPQMTNGVNPSPVKPAKRVISLSEYNNKRKSASKPSSGSSPTVPPATLKTSLPVVDEGKSQILEGAAIVDTPSPMLEKSADPLALKGAAIPESKINPAPPANGAL